MGMLGRIAGNIVSLIERVRCSITCCTQNVKVKVLSPKRAPRSPKKRQTV